MKGALFLTRISNWGRRCFVSRFSEGSLVSDSLSHIGIIWVSLTGGWGIPYLQMFLLFLKQLARCIQSCWLTAFWIAAHFKCQISLVWSTALLETFFSSPFHRIWFTSIDWFGEDGKSRSWPWRKPAAMRSVISQLAAQEAQESTFSSVLFLERRLMASKILGSRTARRPEHDSLGHFVIKSSSSGGNCNSPEIILLM